MSNATLYFNDEITNDKRITINPDGISLVKDLLTTPITALLNQNGINVGSNGSSWQNLALLDDVLASCELPPDSQTLSLNNRVFLKDTLNPQYESQLRNDYCNIIDTINGDNYSFNSNTLQINNPIPGQQSYINMSPMNGLSIQNDQKGGAPTSQANYTYDKATISTAGGPTNSITAGDMTINDNGSIAVSQLTADYLSISGNSGQNITIIYPNQLSFNNSAVAPNIALNGSNQMYIDANGCDVIIDTEAQNTLIGDATASYNQTLFTLNDNKYNIDFSCKNLTMYSNTFTLPISITSINKGNMNYTGPNTWEQPFHFTINFPQFAFDTTSLYNNWKVELSVNFNGFTNPTDKAIAMYFYLQDSVSNTYNGYAYNLNKPFTRHSNQSTYNNTSTDLMTYNWTDNIDFNGVNGNVPLEFIFNWYGDFSQSADYHIVVSFTRTNIV